MNKVYIALYENGLGESGLIGLTSVFAGACIIGVFITIAGEKKLGTKISSWSIIIYFLLKVILGA